MNAPKFLLWKIFNNGYIGGDKYIDDHMDAGLAYFLSVIAAACVGIPFSVMFSVWLGLWTLVVMIPLLVLVVCTPTLGKLHPLNRIEHWVAPDNWTLRSNENRAWIIGRKYLDLSAEDKKQFPSNFIATLSNPNLSKEQRIKLLTVADGILYELTERDKVRAQLIAAAKAQNIDIGGIIEYMEDKRAGIRVESETYREFNEKESIR